MLKSTESLWFNLKRKIHEVLMVNLKDLLRQANQLVSQAHSLLISNLAEEVINLANKGSHYLKMI
jgi:hypothetical protein